MKICITGGNNVYGLNFARYLAKVGIDHFGIGRSGPKTAAFWQVDHDYRFYKLHLIRDFDAVMTTIGVVGRPLSSTARLEALRGRGHLTRFIQVGTSELYGSTVEPARETHRIAPTSPYAISKAAFDLHLEAMFRVHGFPMNIIRPSNCFCPGQQLHRVIPQAFIAALSGRKMRMNGGGVARKSYLQCDDLSHAIAKVIDAGKIGEIYNCGPDEPIRILDLVKHVAMICRAPFESMADITPPRKGEDGCYWLDSSKLKQDTGWQQSVTLNDGLLEMLAWVNKYPEIKTADATFRLTE